MDSNLASPYFLAGLKEQRLANVQILIGDFILTDIEEIASLINILIKNKKSLVIIANDYSAEFIQSILEINTNYDLKVFLLKTPEYGFRQQSILADLGAIANCEIVHAPNAIQYNNLGQIDNMVISNEKCNMDFKYNDKIKRHILRLNENIKNTNTEQDFIAKRITMLESGTAEILVGGITTTERREKRMRFEDALCSVNLAAKGVVPGGGITLAKIADQLSASNDGFHILKEALKEPLKQILINAGLNDIDINTKIKNNNFNRLFNINTNQYEEIEKTRVLDATDVVLNSLKNAVSIASILLTTSSVVINEYKANSNSQNIYEEL